MIALHALRKKTAETLSAVCGDSAAYDADLLIEKAYGITRSELITKSADSFDESLVLPLVERRLGGEPTQYILGEWEIYGLPFFVGKGVLIPRQDTEILVERSLKLIKDKVNPRVLELCSGSGCIAVALAKHRPDADVTAVELYGEAMRYLERNVERNSVQVEIRRFDVLDVPTDFGEYDLIVSNPPYITCEAMKCLQNEVKCEPHTALCGGEDGLEFYRAIAEKWLPLLKSDGAVAVEIGYDQAESVRGIFSSHLITATCEQDLAGLDRVIYGTINRL